MVVEQAIGGLDVEGARGESRSIVASVRARGEREGEARRVPLELHQHDARERSSPAGESPSDRGGGAYGQVRRGVAGPGHEGDRGRPAGGIVERDEEGLIVVAKGHLVVAVAVGHGSSVGGQSVGHQRLEMCPTEDDGTRHGLSTRRGDATTDVANDRVRSVRGVERDQLRGAAVQVDGVAERAVQIRQRIRPCRRDWHRRGSVLPTDADRLDVLACWFARRRTHSG